MTPIVLIRGLQMSSLSGGDWMRILIIVFTSGVGAHMLVNWAHPYVKVSVSSVIVLLSPVVASVSAWAILGESLSDVQLLGGLVVLVAIVALTRTQHRPEDGIVVQAPELPAPTVAGG